MSCRTPGFGTMILNLVKQDNNRAIQAKAKVDNVPIPPWQFAFMDGAANEIYGFCLDSRFAGLKFAEIVQRCFKVGTSDATCIHHVHPPRHTPCRTPRHLPRRLSRHPPRHQPRHPSRHLPRYEPS